MTDPELQDALLRAAELARIGNQAAQAVQESNRRRGIVNWYSINGRLVSDAGAVTVPPPLPGPAADPSPR